MGRGWTRIGHGISVQTRPARAEHGAYFRTGSGEQCLSPVSDLKPDVLLLDIKLRKRAGIEVLREIAIFHPAVHSILPLQDHFNY
jgi:DNA-binding NarL/FixJ family response regulator